jgi:hypothetical protein
MNSSGKVSGQTGQVPAPVGAEIKDINKKHAALDEKCPMIRGIFPHGAGSYS